MKKIRYPKVYRATICNPSAFSEKQLTIDAGSALTSSISFWPENYALQIDAITLSDQNPDDSNYDSNKAVQIFFSLKERKIAGETSEPFINWANDLFDILGSYMDFEACTLKFYNDALSRVIPNETFEIVPYSEASHFTPDDFSELLKQKQERHQKPNVKIFDMFSESVDDNFGGIEYFIQNNVNPDVNFPLPVVGSGRELFKKMIYNPGSHLRTIIAPADEQVINSIRGEVAGLYNDILGANFPVVNIRTTFSHTWKVPFDVKRVLSTLAKDSELTKILRSEEEELRSSPVDAVRLSPRIALTATAFIRIPHFDHNSPYFTCFNSSIDGESGFQTSLVPEELKLLQNMIRSEIKVMLPTLYDTLSKDIVGIVTESIAERDKVSITANNPSTTGTVQNKQNSSEVQSEVNSECNISKTN